MHICRKRRKKKTAHIVNYKVECRTVHADSALALWEWRGIGTDCPGIRKSQNITKYVQSIAEKEKDKKI